MKPVKVPAWQWASMNTSSSLLYRPASLRLLLSQIGLIGAIPVGGELLGRPFPVQEEDAVAQQRFILRLGGEVVRVDLVLFRRTLEHCTRLRVLDHVAVPAHV